jgi:hypothetical protein
VTRRTTAAGRPAGMGRTSTPVMVNRALCALISIVG